MAKDQRSYWFRDSSYPTNLTFVESEIMRVVWDAHEPITVRDVYEVLRERKQVAYTTVMSLMSKLARKGFLKQDRSETAYVYSAVMTDAEVAGHMVNGIRDKILAGAEEPMLSHLLGSRKKLTAAQAKELGRLLEKKKR